MNNILQSKAVIVQLMISQWTARKFDRKVTKEVEDAHKTTNVGRFNKLLIADDELKKINKLASGIRTFHYDNTLAWGDDGSRLLPSANFLDYTAQLHTLKTEFENQVSEFVKVYPSLIDEAKIRMNGMFNPAEYPADVRSRFDIKVSVLPVPDAGDFRVELQTSEINQLKENLEIELGDRFKHAMKDIWGRVKDVLSAMHERLSKPEAVFRDTLITNISDLVGLLPKLNVTGDKDVENMCGNLQSLIVAPDDLRQNVVLRNRKAQDAAALLKQIDNYF